MVSGVIDCSGSSLVKAFYVIIRQFVLILQDKIKKEKAIHENVDVGWSCNNNTYSKRILSEVLFVDSIAAGGFSNESLFGTLWRCQSSSVHRSFWS